MERRTLLKYLGISAVGIPLGVCLESTIASAKEKGGVEWGYIGKERPEEWSHLSPAYATCSSGVQQSPINIDTPVSANIGEIQISYQDAPLRIINNGHTIQVNYAPGSKMTTGDKTYNLLQFHFHTPSEHAYKGEHYPMELHMVHQNQDKELAVLGIFLKQGQQNKALQKIWDAMPIRKGSEKTISGVMVNAEELLPQRKAFYEYFGSLTTPPCSEDVKWIVLEEPIEVSLEQIQKFKKAIPLNARPVQNLNRRFVLEKA